MASVKARCVVQSNGIVLITRATPALSAAVALTASLLLPIHTRDLKNRVRVATTTVWIEHHRVPLATLSLALALATLTRLSLSLALATLALALSLLTLALSLTLLSLALSLLALALLALLTLALSLLSLTRHHNACPPLATCT